MAEIPYDCKFAPHDLSQYSGLLLIGGGDVLPAFYNGSLSAKNVNFIRDKVELDAIDYFYKNDLPIMGVCRGLQILNVYFGGSLKCVNSHSDNGADVCHSIIKVAEGRKFFNVISCHCQAIDAVAKNGKVIYLSPDNVVEEVDFSDKIFGVQFHPERSDGDVITEFYGKFAALFNSSKNSPSP